jgi:hypothetical protein
MVINYTGATQQVIIPNGVTQITITAYGAQGGINTQSVQGGLGGMATGVLTVTPGDVLNVFVGGTNGFNGGGAAGINSGCANANGGVGGGASDIRLNGLLLSNRVIVGAGGGGAGGERIGGCGRGAGGGGGCGYPSSSTVVPTGGTQSAGGSAGVSAFSAGQNGFVGLLGIGGNGGTETGSNQGGANSAFAGGNGGGLIGANGQQPPTNVFTGQSGAGGSSYFGGVTSATTASGVQTGNGQVIIIGVNGLACVSASRAAVTVSVNANPTVTAVSSTSLICNGQTASLTASGANTYSWNTSATTSVVAVSPTVTTSYTVTGTANGCSNVATITQSVSACTGIDSKLPSLTGVMIYPNPTTGVFTVELNNGSTKIIEVIDVTGRIVLANTTSNDKVDFNINTLANGVYYIKIQSTSSIEVIKIVKQ